MAKLGAVITFEEQTDGTYKPTGRTEIVPFEKAINLYAEIPNPPSQIASGNTKEEVESQAEIIIKNMADKDYVEEFIEPYI